MPRRLRPLRGPRSSGAAGTVDPLPAPLAHGLAFGGSSNLLSVSRRGRQGPAQTLRPPGTRGADAAPLWACDAISTRRGVFRLHRKNAGNPCAFLT